jgi:hypothetical protein
MPLLRIIDLLKLHSMSRNFVDFHVSANLLQIATKLLLNISDLAFNNTLLLHLVVLCSVNFI